MERGDIGSVACVGLNTRKLHSPSSFMRGVVASKTLTSWDVASVNIATAMGRVFSLNQVLLLCFMIHLPMDTCVALHRHLHRFCAAARTTLSHCVDHLAGALGGPL